MFMNGGVDRDCPAQSVDGLQVNVRSGKCRSSEKGEVMDRLRNEWANTSTKSRIVMAVVFGAALIFLAMSLGGVVDFAPVETGVSGTAK